MKTESREKKMKFCKYVVEISWKSLHQLFSTMDVFLIPKSVKLANFSKIKYQFKKCLVIFEKWADLWNIKSVVTPDLLFSHFVRCRRQLENVWMLTRLLFLKYFWKEFMWAWVHFRWIMLKLTIFQVCGQFSHEKVTWLCMIEVLSSWLHKISELSSSGMVFLKWLIWYSYGVVIWWNTNNQEYIIPVLLNIR